MTEIDENKDVYDVLNSKEAIRLRSGMYIGSKENPRQLFKETIDNSIDELVNGKGSFVMITFDDINHQYCVTDNGSGIKCYKKTLDNGDVKESVEILFTIPHSGSKFDNKEYKKLFGMNGIGLVAVNYLSDYVIVKTRGIDDKNIVCEYTFIDGDLTKIEYNNLPFDQNPWMTHICFKPSNEFKSLEIDKTYFMKWFLLLQSKYQDKMFMINNKQLPIISYIDYIKAELECNTNLSIIENIKDENTSIRFYISFQEDDDIKISSEVNDRICSKDSLFNKQFTNLLVKTIKEKLDKKFETINEKYILSGLRLYSSVTLPSPEFNAQIKDKLETNLYHDIQQLADKINSFLTKSVLQIIINNIENRFKQKNKPKASVKKSFSAEDSKLKDCEVIPGKICYILEGDSALGSLKQVRDTKHEAIFPLRGKFLNVEKASFLTLQNNRLVKELNEILGPINDRRYLEIGIICDADSDGWHIIVLLILYFYKFGQDYIKNKRVFIIFPPLYGVEKGSNFIPIYSTDPKEADQYISKGYTFQRFKGLGEMSPEKLSKVVYSGVKKYIEWPENKQELDLILSIVEETEIKKELLNDLRFSYETLLTSIFKK